MTYYEADCDGCGAPWINGLRFHLCTPRCYFAGLTEDILKPFPLDHILAARDHHEAGAR